MSAGAAVARVEELARLLLEAESAAAPMEPVSASLEDAGLPEAYAIQSAGRALRLQAGGRLVGHKIGLTSRAMQQFVGVEEPDYGYLLEDMIVEDGAAIAPGTLIAPRVEGEIAFTLASALSGPGVTAQDVLDATATVCVAIEVIDSRIADWRITILDTIADNASCGRAVLGAPVALDGLDLPGLSMRMTVDGELVEGRGDAVLGHPAESVAWLVRALHAQGEALQADQVVLSGALARAVPVAPGSHATVEIDALGSVSVAF